MTTIGTYREITTQIDKRTSTLAKDPSVSLATKYFEDNIGKVTSVDDFVNNYRLFSYAMTAYGLEDRVSAKALVKKMLTQDQSDSKSLVNTLSDSRLKAFSAAFSYLAKGTAATSDAVATTTSKYLRQKLEDKAGDSNEGVELALYFQRQAPNITSMYGILADKKLLEVVQTTFGISETTSAQDIDKQATMLAKYVKLDDLKDPTKLNRLIERFSARYDMNSATTTTNPIVALFDTSSSTSNIGFSDTLMAAIQKVRLGG